MHGNGPPGKSGKGAGKKGRGKEQAQPANTTGDEEATYTQRIQRAIPQAAKARTLPGLHPQEWSAPVVLATELSRSGGNAVCPKWALPELLERVGARMEPTAILTTQSPPELGLKGYMYDLLTCALIVRDEDGATKDVECERFLCQLGFGTPVAQAAEGTLFSLPNCMLRATMKFPAILGWTHDMITASTASRLLDQWTPAGSYSEVQCRQNMTVTFRTHTDTVEKLLRASGQDNVFIKINEAEQEATNLELLWLPHGTTYDQAIAYANDDKALGLAMKNSKLQPRYALRFQAVTDLQHFAKRRAITDTTHLGRWKMTGVGPQVGAAGVLAALQTLNWKVDEVLYCAQSHAVFLAAEKGSDSPLYTQQGMRKKQIRFHDLHALNAVAKQQQSSQAQASRPNQARHSRPPRALAANAWAQSTVQSMNKQTPAKRGEKRPATQHTGSTPDRKKTATECHRGVNTPHWQRKRGTKTPGHKRPASVRLADCAGSSHTQGYRTPSTEYIKKYPEMATASSMHSVQASNSKPPNASRTPPCGSKSQNTWRHHQHSEPGSMTTETFPK